MTSVKVAYAVNLYSTILPLLCMTLASIYLETILPAIGLIRHAPHPLQSLNPSNIQNIQNNLKPNPAGSASSKPGSQGPLKPAMKLNVKPKVSLPALTPHISKQTQPTNSQPPKAPAFPTPKPTSNPLLATINKIMSEFATERGKSKDNKLSMGTLVERCEKKVSSQDVPVLREKIERKTAELAPIAGWYKRVITADTKNRPKLCSKCLLQFVYYIAASYNYIWTLKAVVEMKKGGKNLQMAIAKVNEEMKKPLSLGEVNKAVKEYRWFANHVPKTSPTRSASASRQSGSSRMPNRSSSSSGQVPKLHASSSSSAVKKPSASGSGSGSGSGYASAARKV